MRILFASFGLLLAAAWAQAPPLTVDGAVTQAIKKNPRLSAARLDIAAARAGVDSARATANPEIVVTPPLTAGGSDEEIFVRLPLEINGTRAARSALASANLKRTEALAVVELRDLVFKTKSAYFTLARARMQRDLATEAFKTAEEFDRLTRRQVELGRRPGIELAQTGIETAKAQQLLVAAEKDVVLAESALNTLMGLAANEPIGTVSLPPFEQETVDPEAARRQAQTRAEITAEEAAAEGLRQVARLARAEGRPDVAPQLRMESFTRGPRDVGFGIGVTLPLFDFGSRRNRIRQADESARAQQERAKAARNDSRLDVEQALGKLRAAEKTVASYREGILDRARRLMEGQRTLFIEGAGRANILTVLDAQRTFRSVQTDYNNALADYAQALAEIEWATAAHPASGIGRTK